MIDDLLASGGMAQIYRAHHELMRRVVAVKVLTERYRTRPDIRSRAISEARALAEIDHPNVVRIFHAGEHPTIGPYIVMELLEGRNLRQIMRRTGPMAVKQALTYGIEIAEATHALHGLGIIHRDLKPDNIFVTRERRTLKLLDLGAAKIEKYGARTTGNFQTIGTASYMSPEHLDAKKITPASDVYSLGHVIYELIAGNHAFLINDSAPPTPENFSRWQRLAVPDPLSKVAPNVSQSTSRVVARALEKDPENRFTSMRDFAIALQAAFREELSTSAPPDPSASEVQAGKGKFGTDLMVPQLNAAELQRAQPRTSRGTIKMTIDGPLARPASSPRLSDPPRAAAFSDARRTLNATPSPVTVDDAPPRSGQKIAFAILGGLVFALIAVVALLRTGVISTAQRQPEPAPPQTGAASVVAAQPPAAPAALKEDPLADPTAAPSASAISTAEAPSAPASAMAAPRP